MESTTPCPNHLAAMALKNSTNATVDHSKMDHSQMNHSQMNHDMGGMLHDGMMMSFHGGYEETILFDFWKTDNITAFIFSCLGLFVCAVLYEGLKLAREKLMIYEVKNKGTKVPGDIEGEPKIKNCHCPSKPDCDETEIMNVNNNNSTHPNCCQANSPNNRDYLINNQESSNIVYKSTRSILFSRSHICQTLLHMFQISVSYLLMLVFMTYNTWLCLSVVLGAGLGYFIFGVQRVTSIDVNEHCH